MQLTYLIRVVRSALVLGFFGANGCTKAQGGGTFDPLSLPNAPVICQSVPPKPFDSAQVVLVFNDSNEPVYQRQIRATYKISGDPVSLIITALEKRDSVTSIAHMVFLKLTPGAKKGVRSALKNDSTAAPLIFPDSSIALDPGLPKGFVPLTESERSRADSLARWLWDHRCPGVYHPATKT